MRVTGSGKSRQFGSTARPPAAVADRRQPPHPLEQSCPPCSCRIMLLMYSVEDCKGAREVRNLNPGVRPAQCLPRLTLRGPRHASLAAASAPAAAACSAVLAGTLRG